VAREDGLDRLRKRPPVLIFDELHKHGRWKTFLKGLFDRFADRARIIVTGSSRLDVYRRGGDSLMGRYFLYRMHPLSIGELLRPALPETEVHLPRPLDPRSFDALWEHGGYPEPYVRRDRRFSNRWQGLRRQQLVREDVRDLTRVQELGQIEVLATLLAERSGMPLVYANLAQELHVSLDTVRRWVAILESLHYGFLIRPWFRNVAKSLRKEPKWYLTDWSALPDVGQRAETLVAVHLLKSVHLWQDLGFGGFELRYLRDKEKREVDFLVVRDRRPWFLVETKVADLALSPALLHFQRQVGAAHAFQAVLELDPVEADCFERRDPCVVPARTLLSQLA
jgi:predicted AAA+ superfamily ATPase